ncbi:unnamed protein product [Toxocara canis]|uniref:Uncharacterized protein n=1 Tax=Toxocara canis TaxID=6265 RepID=A0A3P7FNY4_TOXCA|nr:unnamed protein product [Toxocara canis]
MFRFDEAILFSLLTSYFIEFFFLSLLCLILYFRYVYRKRWELKPLDEWCCPPLKLSSWEFLEIFLDAYATYRLLRGFYKTFMGQRSLLAQMAHILFWKTFIATDRRISYYSSLGRLLASSAFHITVKNGLGEGVSEWSVLYVITV